MSMVAILVRQISVVCASIPPNRFLPWTDLKNVEHLVDGESRIIYTAEYNGQPVIAKVNHYVLMSFTINRLRGLAALSSDKFVCCDVRHGDDVQILKQSCEKNEQCVREIQSEVELMQRFSHPCIAKFFGSGTEPRTFLVMELLDGGSLSQRLGHTAKYSGR